MLEMDKATLAKKASLLHLNSVALAEGMRSGSFRSLYKGRGIEFSGVREYLDGDDIRAIDWNVTARMGKPFVKQYEEERDLNVMLIVDVSRSMRSGSGRQSRLDMALECASLVTLASFHNSSPVGAVIFDGEIQFNCPPAPGHDQVMLLLSEFSTIGKHSKNGSALDNALLGARKLLKKRTLVMIFSDFRTSEWGESFGNLCQKHDVIAVRITDALDEILPSVGAVPFTDPESGFRLVLPTSSPKFRRAWREEHDTQMDLWRHECIRQGGIPLVLNTKTDPLKELTRFFEARER
ncbi:MAG TPA: DUF58 domain-containing protein [Treponema sp.]|jgi:uncharacterized protein (DUF58 family)|nr:DUF58 domain-containing protein [Treponema sp.]HBB42528.1 DUF58 domain-containing protein [Treponema sp.]HCA19799.1 DUF58 domain-containing protein [Treponema sp.]